MLTEKRKKILGILGLSVIFLSFLYSITQPRVYVNEIPLKTFIERKQQGLDPETGYTKAYMEKYADYMPTNHEFKIKKITVSGNGFSFEIHWGK
jgi:hypothetical protein